MQIIIIKPFQESFFNIVIFNYDFNSLLNTNQNIPVGVVYYFFQFKGTNLFYFFRQKLRILFSFTVFFLIRLLPIFLLLSHVAIQRLLHNTTRSFLHFLDRTSILFTTTTLLSFEISNLNFDIFFEINFDINNRVIKFQGP